MQGLAGELEPCNYLPLSSFVEYAAGQREQEDC